MKWKHVMDNPETYKEKLKILLQPVGSLPEKTKPTICQWHVDSFKNVDRFNSLIGILKWREKFNKKELVWWYYPFIIAVINSFILWNDTNATGSKEDDERNLKDYVDSLCNELL